MLGGLVGEGGGIGAGGWQPAIRAARARKDSALRIMADPLFRHAGRHECRPYSAAIVSITRSRPRSKSAAVMLIGGARRITFFAVRLINTPRSSPRSTSF